MAAPDAPAPPSAARLRALAERWADAAPAERANYALYLVELCDALGVERPRPASAAAGADPAAAEAAAYQFEFPVRATARDGTTSTNFVDLYKAGCFALEAKDIGGDVGAAAEARRLTKAFGQVVNYARDLAERPPYILVLDVGRTLVLWDRWAGTYGGVQLGHRVDLRTLADRPADAQLLRDVWTDPARRDPRRHAQAVTVEIAGVLGALAGALEARGHAPERVARFLIRCVFTMFAEDVGLLPDAQFTRLLDAVLGNPLGNASDDAGARFVEGAEALWGAMDRGALFGYHRLLRFNGHFFADARALPLAADDVRALRRAAAADWSAVEPSIFGTLLVRALSAEERHRLGAEYTPRAFIERLVRPTVEEPVRERWAAVQAEVLQLRERGRAADRRQAEARLVEFHGWLRGLRVLDPACGSGNFLYVTMHALKRVEVEVFRLLAELHEGQLGMRLAEIDPGQFFGIEVKAWAREVAELSLWIGFHQFWRQQHGDVQPDEPLLRDTGTLAHRDAVLAWDACVRRPERDRPDPTPRVRHPVTGQLVPDPAARLPYTEYVGARAAEWPEAEFIVGNPPYLGRHRKRDALGDGYVDALCSVYPELNEGIDLVMYWWWRAAQQVASGVTLRAGLITTNSITQGFNAAVVRSVTGQDARVVWAAPDHPWTDGQDDAAVRVAMTVVERRSASTGEAVRVTVDATGNTLAEQRVPELNADLSATADVDTASSTPLRGNANLAMRGVQPQGEGFQLSAEEGSRLAGYPGNDGVVRPHRNGRDLAARSRDRYIIDFGLMSEAEASQYPVALNLVIDRVKPDRLANKRASYAKYWWRLGEPRPGLRAALAGLTRFIVTPETSAHRFFTFIDTGTSVDNSVVAVASDDAFLLGVLSSQIHLSWASAAGTRLGVGNDERYNNPRCFDAFPFPDPAPNTRARIADAAERLDAHRKAALARDSRVTMTGMYNVVARLRAGAPLTDKERAVHELAACGVLRDLHDALDALVAEAYGWPWPLPADDVLARLVALHDARVAEEAAGQVRWLRPAYQAPGDAGPAPALDLPAAPAPAAPGTAAADPADPLPAWPADALGQIGALKRLVAAGPLSAAEAAERFAGARRDLVERHLDTLALLGEVRPAGAGRYAAAAPL